MPATKQTGRREPGTQPCWEAGEVFQPPVSRDAAPSIWNKQDIFSVSKTEPDMFLKEATERGFLQQQRADLSGPAHPHFVPKTASSSLWIVKEHNKARQPPYGVALLQFKFKQQYQNEEPPTLQHIVFSACNLSALLNSLLQLWLSQHPVPQGITLFLLFSPSFRDLSHQAFKPFCQPGSPVGDNSAECWRRNLKLHPGGESNILSKTHLSAHNSVTAQQENLHVVLKDSLICCLFSHLPAERDLQCNVPLTQ